MAGRRVKLTAEVQAHIVAFIQGGAFDWVAAQAAGIGKSTFYRWMQQGEREGRGIYREFFVEVSRARAQARVAAEIEVRRDNPLAWLRFGPGRARPDEPGWTESREISGHIEMVDPRLEALDDEQLERFIRVVEAGNSGMAGTQPQTS